MTKDELRAEIETNWSKVSNKKLVHKTKNVTITLADPHPYIKNQTRKFLVRINDDWVLDYPHKWIKEYRTLEDAVVSVNKRTK